MKTSHSDHYDLSLSQNELANIYLTLSDSPDTDFDVCSYLSFVDDCIEEVFDKNFLQSNPDELIKNTILINTKFVDLLKFCLGKNDPTENNQVGLISKTNKSNKTHHIGYIFLAFCEYFNLDSHKVFCAFQDKLQMVIKKSVSVICGKDVYNKCYRKKQKEVGIGVTTIFNV